MMSFLGEWIRHIILLILVATFLDLLLPSSSMRRYVKLVVGLLLILLILSPILQLFKFDQDRLLLSLDQLIQEEDRSSRQQLAEEQKRFEKLQEETVLTEVSMKWAEEIKKGLERQFLVSIQEVTLKLGYVRGNVEVESLNLAISTAQEHKESVQTRRVEEVKSVEPIVIAVNGNQRLKEDGKEVNGEEKKLEEELLTYLWDEWNISVDKIYFSWTRR